LAQTHGPQTGLEHKVTKMLTVFSSGGSRPSVWGDSQLGGAKEVFIPKVSSRIVGYHTKVVAFCRLRKSLFFLVKLCDVSGNNHSLEALYINNSENV